MREVGEKEEKVVEEERDSPPKWTNFGDDIFYHFTDSRAVAKVNF